VLSVSFVRSTPQIGAIISSGCVLIAALVVAEKQRLCCIRVDGAASEKRKLLKNLCDSPTLCPALTLLPCYKCNTQAHIYTYA
jgi:hypothetical protein